MVAIYNFAKDYLAPVIGKTLGLAFEALGKFIGGAIDVFAELSQKIGAIYDRIKGIIDAIKGAGSAVGNFFSGASMNTGATSPATPSPAPAPIAPAPTPTVPRYIYAGMGTTNITVNGAIDSESTARQIVGILKDSSARGTLVGGFIYA